MAKLFLDIETTLFNGTLPNKIWCLVTICDKGNIVYYTSDDIHKFQNVAVNYSEFIGHNIIGFDAPVIKNVLGVDLFKIGKVTDTIILSRLFNPVREGGHSLKAFGLKFGYKKFDFNDFTKFSQEMLKYCIRDVKLLIQVYTLLNRQGVNFSKESIELEHDVAKIITQQVSNGFLLDQEKAHLLLARLQQRVDEVQTRVRETFIPLKIETTFTPKVNNKARGYVKGIPFTKVKYQEFNLGSRQQIGERLINLGWKPKKCTDKGHVIVDEKVLSEIKDIPEAELIKEFLLLQKRVAMIESWIKAVREDGRVHGKVIKKT